MGNSVGGVHTGWKMDTTEGTESTLVAGNFVGDWDAQEIQQDRKIVTLAISGTKGVAKTLKGSSKGTLSGFSMPVSNLLEKDLFQVAGADYTLLTGTTTMNIGGQVFQKTGVNASRISIKSLTINQYNSKQLIKLLSAKVSKLELSGKFNEAITLSADFAGIYSYSTNAGYAFLQTPATSSPIIYNGSSVTLDGVAMKCSEVSIDFGISYQDVADGSNPNGYGMGEITNVSPVITINPLAVADTEYNFYSKLDLGTTINFVWTFGSGTGNSYTVSATGVITSLKGSLDNDIQRKEVVLTVINSASNYGVKIVNV